MIKIILFSCVCLVSLSSYSSEENLFQLLPSIEEGDFSLGVQRSASDLSDSGYVGDREALIREDSSLSSRSLSDNPVLGVEVFIDMNGNLVVSLKEGVWGSFPKVLVCQGGRMMEYKRKQHTDALVYPESFELSDVEVVTDK